MVEFTAIEPILLRSDSRQWDISPAELDMEDVNLDQASGVVAATSPFLDLRNFFNYKLFVGPAAVTAMSAGHFKITLEEFAAVDVLLNPINPTPIDSEDILTVISAIQNGQKEILLWGATIDGGALFSSGGGVAATKSLNLNKHRMLFVARLKLEITQTGNGTSSTVSVRLQCGD